MREIFRRSGHLLPDTMATTSTATSGMTLTAVFAPGVSVAGGGEDVAKALQAATVAAGAKWTYQGETATHTIIILTGALLASPVLAKQVWPCNALLYPDP